MNKPWTVLGGWAVPPEILQPVFGKEARYIDTNRIMPFLIESDHIKANWKQQLFSLINTTTEPIQHLGGWSMGTLLMLGILPFLPLKEALFISATPSFCRRNEFRSGLRTSVLSSMIEHIKRNKAEVLQQFYIECGLDSALNSNNNYNLYSNDELIAGLIFLRETAFLPPPEPKCCAVFMHGKNDTIIPVEAGRVLCSQFNGKWIQREGTHAFFSASEYENNHLQETISGKEFTDEFF